jgi:hypothetical protein
MAHYSTLNVAACLAVYHESTLHYVLRLRGGMPGTKTAAELLASGKATGNIRFPALCGGGFLKVLKSEGKGRGLFAASDFKKGALIAVAPVKAKKRGRKKKSTSKSHVIRSETPYPAMSQTEKNEMAVGSAATFQDFVDIFCEHMWRNPNP